MLFLCIFIPCETDFGMLESVYRIPNRVKPLHSIFRTKTYFLLIAKLKCGFVCKTEPKL